MKKNLQLRSEANMRVSCTQRRALLTFIFYDLH